MASSKNRQRALARAKMERQIARRAAAARRRRQLQGGIGAVLVVLLVGGGLVWINGGFSHLFSHKKKTNPVASGVCAWTPQAGGSNPNLKNVGTPATSGIATSGTATMTITTNQGVIEAQLDAAKAPCTVASFMYLAGKQFFNNTKCHRLTTQGIYVLQCGDPSGTGQGGPSYKFPDENLPEPPPAPQPSGSAAPSPSNSPSAPPTNLYPEGTLAMANSGADTNGSQFFVVYKDGSALDAKYSIFGIVTKGLDIVQKIAQTGVQGVNGQPQTDGKPKTDVTIQSLTVSTPATAAPSANPGGSAKPGTAPSNPNS